MNLQYCGSFWQIVIPLLYESDVDDSVFENILEGYARITGCFAVLGKSERKYIEMMVQTFMDGMKVHLSKCLTDNYAGEAAVKVVGRSIDKMRLNCRSIADAGGEDDSIVTEFIDYFMVSVAIGIIEYAGIDFKSKRSGGTFCCNKY